MTRYRRLAAVTVATALVAALTACISPGADQGGAAASPDTVRAEIARMNLGERVFAADGGGVRAGLASVWESNATAKLTNDVWKATLAARGATGTVVPANPVDPISSLVSAMDTLVSQKVRVVAYYPIDPSAMIEPSERAAAAGIPVFPLETTPWDGATSTLHLARGLAAASAADLLCRKYPQGGEVVYGEYGQTQPDLIEYQREFTDLVRACSGGRLSVTGTYQNKTDDVTGGLANAQAALQQHPNTVAVVAYNDVNAVSASRAATNLGVRDRVTIVGFNLARDGVGYLRDGVIDYSFLYGTGFAGQMLANAQVDTALGRPVPRYVTLWPRCFSTATAAQLPSDQTLVQAAGDGLDLSRSGIQPISTSDTEQPLRAPDAVARQAACPQ